MSDFSWYHFLNHSHLIQSLDFHFLLIQTHYFFWGGGGLCWVFVAAHELSLIAVSGDNFLVMVCGFLIVVVLLSLIAVSGDDFLVMVCGFLTVVVLLLQSMGSIAHGLQYLQPVGLVALWHVGSSWTRDWTGLLHWQADSLPGKPRLTMFVPQRMTIMWKVGWIWTWPEEGQLRSCACKPVVQEGDVWSTQ